MSRGLVFFVLQLVLVSAVIAVGCIALTRPRSVQRFLNTNFYLLPDADKAGRITPVFVIMFGVFMLYYGAQLVVGVKQEIVYAIDMIRQLSG